MGRYSGKTCRLIFMLVLTVGFFVAELVSGYLGNSLALVSDSFNMLSDLISLCVGLSTGRIARRSRRGPRATYGYSRAEAVGALSNAVFLTALCFTILVDSVLRLAQPEPIDDAQLVLIVGTLGLAVNVVGLLVFQDWGACCRGRRPCPPAPAAAALRDVPGGIPNGEEDEAGAFRLHFAFPWCPASLPIPPSSIPLSLPHPSPSSLSVSLSFGTRRAVGPILCALSKRQGHSWAPGGFAKLTQAPGSSFTLYFTLGFWACPRDGGRRCCPGSCMGNVLERFWFSSCHL